MPQHLTEVYETKYRGPAGQQKHLALWHREVLKLLETLNKEQHLLEVGCGNGRLLAAIAELGFDAVGIDVSSEAIVRCRGKGLKAECVDVSEGIPYEDRFNICVSAEVIEHIFDPYHFLGQVNKSLKLEGLAILTTPNFGYYLWQWRYLRGESPSQIQNPLHIRFFTATYLHRIALLQGFNVLRMYSPVQRFRWAEMIFQSLKLQPQWEALTRRWGKTLFAVLEKVDTPQYANLAQVMEQAKK
jgi:2-polyprenyl-3-methyl-5-hydroxy-6-metoxy-1,4-benzoquinol methylase